MYIVYIIQMKNGLKYTGFTTDLKKRIERHKSGSVRSVKIGVFDRLLFFAAFSSKKVALDFEKYLKSSSGKAFRNKHLL